MSRPTRVLVYGFLTWSIPFVVSLALFGRDGQPVLDIRLVKSIMVVAGALTGAVLLARFFSSVSASASSGMAVGLAWFVLNVGLDFVVLLPMTKMTPSDYFGDIGLRYLTIPIMATAMGEIGQRQRALARRNATEDP